MRKREKVNSGNTYKILDEIAKKWYFRMDADDEPEDEEEGDDDKKTASGWGLRLPYALCKEIGIDTDGMTPSEAWDAYEDATGKSAKKTYEKKIAHPDKKITVTKKDKEKAKAKYSDKDTAEEPKESKKAEIEPKMGAKAEALKKEYIEAVKSKAKHASDEMISDWADHFMETGHSVYDLSDYEEKAFKDKYDEIMKESSDDDEKYSSPDYYMEMIDLESDLKDFAGKLGVDEKALYEATLKKDLAAFEEGSEIYEIVKKGKELEEHAKHIGVEPFGKVEEETPDIEEDVDKAVAESVEEEFDPYETLAKMAEEPEVSESGDEEDLSEKISDIYYNGEDDYETSEDVDKAMEICKKFITGFSPETADFEKARELVYGKEHFNDEYQIVRDAFYGYDFANYVKEKKFGSKLDKEEDGQAYEKYKENLEDKKAKFQKQYDKEVAKIEKTKEKLIENYAPKIYEAATSDLTFGSYTFDSVDEVKEFLWNKMAEAKDVEKTFKAWPYDPKYTALTKEFLKKVQDQEIKKKDLDNALNTFEPLNEFDETLGTKNSFVDRTVLSLQRWNDKEAEYMKNNMYGDKFYGEYTKEQMQKAQKTLQNVFDKAEFVTNINSEYLDNVLTDSLKNQFQVKHTDGSSDKEARKTAARNIFGLRTKGVKPADREKYGYIVDPDDYDNTLGFDGPWYGGSGSGDRMMIIMNKDKIKDRTTYTASDSLSASGFDSGYYMAGGVDTNVSLGGMSYKRHRLKALVDGECSTVSDLRQYDSSYSYIEAQYHGHVSASDFAEIRFSDIDSARDAFKNWMSEKAIEVVKKNNIKIGYFGDDKHVKYITLEDMLKKL